MRMQCLMPGSCSQLCFLPDARAPGRGCRQYLAKMRKAIDPDGLTKDITTQVSHPSWRPPAKGWKHVVEIKYPSEIRIRANPRTHIHEGIWWEERMEFSTKNGLREIKGKELDNLKFQIMFLSPKEGQADIWINYAAGEDAVNKKVCYKLSVSLFPHTAWPRSPYIWTRRLIS